MKSFVGLLISLLLFPSLAVAARPLSTDDAGTVEKAHLEIESGFEYANQTDDEYTWATTIKCGLLENWDVGVEIPYKFIEVSGGDDVDGLSDVSFSSKYCLVDEKTGFPALAISYSIKTETGDEGKGLGTGEIDHAINMILSKELKKVVGHLNLSYTYSGTSGGHDDVFSYKLGLEFPVNHRLNLVGEFTGETNFEGDFDDNPFAGLVGLNYALSDMTTFDLGFGWGISNASSDYTITTGLTLSF